MWKGTGSLKNRSLGIANAKACILWFLTSNCNKKGSKKISSAEMLSRWKERRSASELRICDALARSVLAKKFGVHTLRFSLAPQDYSPMSSSFQVDLGMPYLQHEGWDQGVRAESKCLKCFYFWNNSTLGVGYWRSRVLFSPLWRSVLWNSFPLARRTRTHALLPPPPPICSGFIAYLVKELV